MSTKLKAVALLPLAVSAYAADDSATQDTMVVTANRTSQVQDAVLAPFSVVTREEIEKSAAGDLLDVLRRQPGVQITQNGGRGQVEGIFLRGAAGSQSLFLIDGHRVNTATNGLAQLSLLPLDMVERVEIVRGARASVYGSDAIGGVINVITRPAFGDESGQVKIAGGSHNTQKAAARKNFMLGEQTQLSLLANLEKSDGYDFRPNDELNQDYGYDTKTAQIGLSHAFNQNLSGGINFLHNDGEVEYIGSAWPNPEEKYLNKQGKQLLSGDLTYQRGAGYAELRLSNLKDWSETGPEANFNNTAKIVTERQSASLLGGYHLSEIWLGQLGFDFYQDDVSESTTQFAETSRNNKAIHAGLIGQGEVLSSELSLRHDDNSAYGGNTTYGIGLGWAVHSSTELVLNHGTAFRAPTFNDLYWPGAENPELKPEKSMNTEVGVKSLIGETSWQLHVYQNDIEDLIAWQPGADGVWRPSNVSEARIKGVELVGDYSTGIINHRVIVEYLDPRDRQTDKLLVRRSQEQFKYAIDTQVKMVTMALDYQWRGKSYADADNTQELPGYSLWDLAARGEVYENLWIGGKVRNLFDQTYSTVNNYQAPGRTYEIDLSYRF